MSDLISRSALLKKANHLVLFGDLYGAIVDAPAVDAVPVVHGEWVFGKNHGDFVEASCTACNGILLVKWYDKIGEYRYCPNCGAKMDGGEEE